MNLYGLIGFPLGHSFSKKYFTEKFETEGLGDCFFELFPINSIDQFPDLIRSHPILKGLAVTIPYKQSVLPFLHQVSDEAQIIGAVNCIKVRKNLLTGFNTDILGFEKSFKPLLQSHHTKALILGTGGSSKAVQFVLNKLHIPFLLVSRTTNKENEFITYADVDEIMMQEYNLIINCTPIGMTPNEEAKPPIPYQVISANHYLYDLVYTPAETQFLREGKKRGAIVKNGWEMLILQANENWKIWNEL